MTWHYKKKWMKLWFVSFHRCGLNTIGFRSSCKSEKTAQTNVLEKLWNLTMQSNLRNETFQPAREKVSLNHPWNVSCTFPTDRWSSGFLGTLAKEPLEICWTMEKIIIQWLFFFSHQVASPFKKPFNFKIALIASHKLPHGSQPLQRCSLEKTEWIMWKNGVCLCFFFYWRNFWDLAV